MKPGARRTLILAIVAFAAALAGVLVGRSLYDHQVRQPNALHELLHEELGLDARQLTQINGIEDRFAKRRRELEAELRADNVRLAAAIEAERGYGPRVTAEIERSHRAMGDLQKETMAHIFEMRAVLRPEQAEKFDRAVVKALTADEK